MLHCPNIEGFSVHESGSEIDGISGSIVGLHVSEAAISWL
jgi:hypothetical protein